jgi:multifunctional methyltransferase subunit TRM112
MVRLLTHNLLACHAKACAPSAAGFPLVFRNVTVGAREAEFNPEFLRGFLPRIEWRALVNAAREARITDYRASREMLI